MKVRLICLQFLAMTALLSAGCSVKEDRNDCPCHLTLDFSETDTLMIPSVDIIVCDGADAVFNRKDVAAREFIPEYFVEVPLTSTSLNVYSGAEDMVAYDGELRIPSGKDCPKVYAFASLLDDLEESEDIKVHLRKEHCVMKIQILDGYDFDWEMKIKGGICGYGQNGQPLKGIFEAVPEKQVSGNYEVVVPRQTDSSLMMEIDDGTDVLKHFAIGEYVSSVGYDWNSPDLEDITVVLDWSLTTIRCTVQVWDRIYEYELVI